jgi:putative MATE family efflux protein
MEERLLQESPKALYKRLLRLALPIMAGQFVHTLYNIADSYFLGKLGKEALAAPSIAFNILMLLMVLGSGFSMAGTTLMAQAKGKAAKDPGERGKVDFYLGQMAALTLYASLALMFAGILFAEPLLALLRVPADVYEPTLIYMRIMMFEIPLMFMSFILASALQAVGNSVTPFKIQLVTVTLNIALDPLLIFGLGFIPSMGVAGAAVATVISRAVAAAISLTLLISGRFGVRLQLRHMALKKESVLLLTRIGLPSSFGQAISTLGFTVMQGAVNAFGTAVIAAFGIGTRIIGLFNMPAMGFSQATATLVGQCLGAKDSVKAKLVVHQSLLTILAFISVAMSLTFFFGASFTRFFVDDPEVIAHGVMQFRIVSLSVVFFALFNVLNGAFQGGGDTVPVMANNIIRLWVLRVPLLYIMAFGLGWGPNGIWWSMFVSNLGVTAIAYALYKTDRWTRKINPDTL